MTSVRLTRAATVAVSVVLVASCTNDGAVPRAEEPPRATGQASVGPSPSNQLRASPEPSGQPSGVVASAAPEASTGPTLPPGDPGVDAPSVPDPGVPKKRHDEPARTAVPVSSMLDARTVGSVLGGSWRTTTAKQPACVSVGGAVAERTTSFRSADGVVLHTVATHDGVRAANQAVDGVRRRLQRCGWTMTADPRVGSSSAAATHPKSAERVVVLAADGVTVTLVGSVRATSDRAAWSTLVDLALGSACAASPVGCD